MGINNGMQWPELRTSCNPPKRPRGFRIMRQIAYEVVDCWIFSKDEKEPKETGVQVFIVSSEHDTEDNVNILNTQKHIPPPGTERPDSLAGRDRRGFVRRRWSSAWRFGECSD
ncbi:uncharacterized protein BP01DRAFT_385013 [Aspergillus saccharolyticus JOP 1030-1]|uniref:Uncharacterized protein n=1 Tax=Aspergillus saccharolyticus JOP 1030-1 TaxID=1450539 RepID=A0A318ZDR3_9EURO|nr:hypothetical protein BP01DRAFT_385013 [Aspergillus saccharolyticus JOP 1030-1]PYH42803.1 hypothetical protein BP01DRAFT_385013 [Aspergillus saccharolyticus JOP 1030-1]